MTIQRTVDNGDIQSLKRLLAGTQAHVYGPSDEGYLATLTRCSRAAEKPAGVSVVPSRSEEVSIAVKFAAVSGLDVAVKAGGHSTAGTSSTDGGVLIDLSRMRRVTVDASRRLIHVQGGSLWSDVNDAAWAHRLATVGGTVADTGVAGLTLGGGYGHLTGQHGLAIDNVVGATVVLADGRIVRASRDENVDLFWGLLGAGQNFGVTTEFVFRAYPQGEVYAGKLIFPPVPDVISRIVDASNDLYRVRDTLEGPQTRAKGRCATLLSIVKPPPAGGRTMFLMICAFMGSEAEGRKAFAPFTDIGPIENTMAMQPYPMINTQVPIVNGTRSSMKGAAFVLPLRAEFVNEVVAKYESFIDTNDDAALSLVAWELYDTVKVTSLDNGSYANRGYHMNALVMPMWRHARNDQVCRQWARDMSNMFKAELQAHDEPTGDGIDGGVGLRGHKGAVMLYGNYDQYDERSKDIFGENYEELQKIKAKYDPGNLFNKLFPITPTSTKA